MSARDQGKRVDVLFLAYLNPNKRGSFEDYICHLSSFCSSNGLNIVFIFGNEVNNSLRASFANFCVNFLPLSIKELNSIWSMAKILKGLKPKIVHLNFTGIGNPLIILSKFMGVDKIIMTEHKSSPLPLRYVQKVDLLESLKKGRRRFFGNRVDFFIAVSNFVGERLEKRNGMPAEKIRVIHNGVDLRRFRPPRDGDEKVKCRKNLFNADEAVSVVAYIGQLIKEKGLLVYLESVKKLVKDHKDILFVFAGSGPLERHLVEYIKKAQSNMIRFVGFRDDAEFILRASDILVVPSIWEEAFGLVIAEASACGVPVIGSRIGAIPEVLIDEETGILTIPGNADELANAIERLVYDTGLKQQFSSAGRKHAEKTFDINIEVSKTFELYQHCLEGSSKFDTRQKELSSRK